MSSVVQPLSIGQLTPARRKEIVARYKQLRATSTKLNERLVRRLNAEALDDGATRLGIKRGRTLVFNSEDESSVLMDYCIHDVRQKGRSAVEQYLIESSLDAESDEFTVLRAMQHSVYTIFEVESVEPGLGVVIRDHRSKEIRFLVDMGLSNGSEPGLVIASRLMTFDDFSMTCGAPLPIGIVPNDMRQKIVSVLLSEINKSSENDPGSLIRALLERSATTEVRYEDPFQTPSPEGTSISITNTPRVGRNDLCPCGSGKKFKRCCLNRS